MLPSAFASRLSLLLFAIIISDMLERSSTEVWGWRMSWWVQRAEPLLSHKSSSGYCRVWQKHPSDRGRKGTDLVSDVPYHKLRARPEGATDGAVTAEASDRSPARRCREAECFPRQDISPSAQTQGGHRAWHRERWEGLAEAAGLAQLCGFQRYLIDSFFPALPHSPNPHMHFSC